jgi:hypothetical protein
LKETLHNANGLDVTRVKRAFKWVVTFRDFPKDSWQTVDGDSMMAQALTLFTKGRAQFFLDGVQRQDRVPGTLSSEHEPVGLGGTFTLRYVEPTSRLCIPAKINQGKLPTVKKHMHHAGDTFEFTAGMKLLVCLGEIEVNGKIFKEEQSVQVPNGGKCTAISDVILLEFI